MFKFGKGRLEFEDFSSEKITFPPFSVIFLRLYSNFLEKIQVNAGREMFSLSREDANPDGFILVKIPETFPKCLPKFSVQSIGFFRSIEKNLCDGSFNFNLE